MFQNLVLPFTFSRRTLALTTAFPCLLTSIWNLLFVVFSFVSIPMTLSSFERCVSRDGSGKGGNLSVILL